MSPDLTLGFDRMGRRPVAFLIVVLLLLPMTCGCPANRQDPLSQTPSSPGSGDDALVGSPLKTDAPSVPAADSNSDSKSDRVAPVEQDSEAGTQAPTQALFDGKSLDGWKVTSFGGEGECRVENGVLVLEPGFPLTGLTSTREDLPKNNYEISLEARKTRGIDFFCGLTFPVDESHCSLIVGGWAGSVVGLSMIDDQDANNNETRKLKKFEPGQWYRIKLRVTPQRITAWIDDEQMVDQDTSGHRFSVRNETMPCRPLGICSFETQSELRNIELKPLAK